MNRNFGNRGQSEGGFIVVATLWILGALATLASIYSLYVANAAVSLSVHDDDIRAESLISAALELTAYQVALECSDILRRYIEARFESPIRYQTTREFLGAAHVNAELSADSRVELGKFLKFFDGIKFAQESATPERTSAAVDDAEQFVRKCIPAEVGVS